MLKDPKIGVRDIKSYIALRKLREKVVRHRSITTIYILGTDPESTAVSISIF